MSYSQVRQAPKRKGPNPILRGLGFIIVVGFLAGGYWVAEWVFTQNALNGWFYVPPQFAGPSFAPMLFAKVIVAVVAMIFGFMIMTIVYGIVDPPRPGELDAPPMRSTGKKSR